MNVSIPLDLLVEIMAMTCGLAVVWAMIRAELRQLRRDSEVLDKRMCAQELETKRLSSIETRVNGLEGLAAKVDRIDPLIERVTQFERHIGDKVDGLGRTLEDMRNLLFRAAAKSGG